MLNEKISELKEKLKYLQEEENKLVIGIIENIKEYVSMFDDGNSKPKPLTQETIYKRAICYISGYVYNHLYIWNNSNHSKYSCSHVDSGAYKYHIMKYDNIDEILPWRDSWLKHLKDNKNSTISFDEYRKILSLEEKIKIAKKYHQDIYFINHSKLGIKNVIIIKEFIKKYDSYY